MRRRLSPLHLKIVNLYFSMSMCRYQPTSFFLLGYGHDTYNFLISQSIAYLDLWNYIFQFTWSHVPIQILFGLIEPKKEHHTMGWPGPPMVPCSSSSNNKPSCSSLSFLLSGLGVLHGVGLRKIWWAVWHENVTINTVQYSNLPHYTIIFDIRMEHLKDLCGMLTYHALPCNVTITLYAFQVMWVYCPTH